MAKACLAVRHVAFEDLGLLGPLVAARGYEVRYHDAGIDRFDSDTLIAPDLVIVLGGPIGVYEAEPIRSSPAKLPPLPRASLRTSRCWASASARR